MTERINGSIPPLAWGLVGPGGIARQFVRGLSGAPGARLVATASRDPQRAASFAAEFGGRGCSDLDDLLADPAVEAVYVATPHPMHHATALAVLEAGKAVLVEKPITMDAAELTGLIAVAQRRNAFLMEAMWTRFLPAMVQVRTWIEAGMIGEPRMLQASFGFRAAWDPSSRLFDPVLGGGGLLDVGCYTIALATMVFQAEPCQVVGCAAIGATGVDEQAAMALAFPGGGLAALTCALRTTTDHTARIAGTEGSIEIPDFWRATTATLRRGSTVERCVLPFAVNGYEYQAIEVARCRAAGLLASPSASWRDSLACMRAMDALRRQWGITPLS